MNKIAAFIIVGISGSLLWTSGLLRMTAEAVGIDWIVWFAYGAGFIGCGGLFYALYWANKELKGIKNERESKKTA